MNAAQSVPAQQKVPSNLRILPEPSSDPGLLDYLSASRLKCWQTCRRQFFFRYVERIATPTAPALFIGQQVHECLKSLNWARWKSEPFDADQLRAEFDESWERGLESESVPWKKEGDEANAKAKAAGQEPSPCPEAEAHLQQSREVAKELEKQGIACELNLVEGSMTVRAACGRCSCVLQTRSPAHAQNSHARTKKHTGHKVTGTTLSIAGKDNTQNVGPLRHCEGARPHQAFGAFGACTTGARACSHARSQARKRARTSHDTTLRGGPIGCQNPRGRNSMRHHQDFRNGAQQGPLCQAAAAAAGTSRATAAMRR